MANYGGSTVDSESQALVANTVDVITLKPCNRVRVINRTGAAQIWARADGSAPTVAGENSYEVSGVAEAFTDIDVQPSAHVQTTVATTDQYHPAGAKESAVQVQLISGGAVGYTVEVVQ